MKLNPRIYNKLTGEPFEFQEINGKKVEFHYMNETPYLYQFASKGRFAVWTSDGNNYKVLIEKSYYEAMTDFYQPEINTIWLGFLENVAAISKRMNVIFLVPMIAIYAIIAMLGSLYFGDQMGVILIGLLILVFVSNSVQSRIVNNKVRIENNKAQDEIRNMIGLERFNQLVDDQQKHYEAYFKFNEPVEEAVVENEEVIETISESGEEGTKDEK